MIENREVLTMAKEKKRYFSLTIVSFLATISAVLITLGVSFAITTYIQKGSRENTIVTGTFLFQYNEGTEEGNGIKLENTLPMSDEEGKKLLGAHNVFDFSVLATVKGAPVTYEIIAVKQANSTLADYQAKLYLTERKSDVIEAELPGTVVNGNVMRYSDLTDTMQSGINGKTIYREVVPGDTGSYHKNFRLRMWLASDVDTNDEANQGKVFSVKLHVYAHAE